MNRCHGQSQYGILSSRVNRRFQKKRAFKILSEFVDANRPAWCDGGAMKTEAQDNAEQAAIAILLAAGTNTVTLPAAGEMTSPEADALGTLVGMHPSEWARVWRQWEWPADLLVSVVSTPSRLLAFVDVAGNHIGAIRGVGLNPQDWFDAPIPDRFTAAWYRRHYRGTNEAGISVEVID
jgi:hypothetical protein